jgi:ring-1,2-phenylacetyl-CoA epoxidase subunit PaaD
MVTPLLSSSDVRTILDEVVDPEIPVLTIADIGILRGVELEDDVVVVEITPTYSGCPAMALIESEISASLERAGVERYEIRTVLSPAWTTDWMSPAAKEKLLSSGITPPGELDAVACPNCGAGTTRTISAFGSTACKALLACENCGEPFHHFKAI